MTTKCTVFHHRNRTVAVNYHLILFFAVYIHSDFIVLCIVRINYMCPVLMNHIIAYCPAPIKRRWPACHTNTISKVCPASVSGYIRMYTQDDTRCIITPYAGRNQSSCYIVRKFRIYPHGDSKTSIRRNKLCREFCITVSVKF